MSDFWTAILISLIVSGTSGIVQIAVAYFLSKWIARRTVKELFEQEPAKETL